MLHKCLEITATSNSGTTRRDDRSTVDLYEILQPRIHFEFGREFMKMNHLNNQMLVILLVLDLGPTTSAICPNSSGVFKFGASVLNRGSCRAHNHIEIDYSFGFRSVVSEVLELGARETSSDERASNFLIACYLISPSGLLFRTFFSHLTSSISSTLIPNPSFPFNKSSSLS